SSADEEVVNLLAENDHNVWARERIKQGWTYGVQQDVKAKQSPQLVPYSLLDERTKRTVREGVREAVCTLLAFGYSLEPLNQEPAKLSQPCPFSTEKCRVFRPDKSNAVTTGKWYFEFEVETDGTMRVGWARPDCTPDKELGSDDQAYVFDGFEAQWYHQGGEALGSTWLRGDVVGCLLDLVERSMMVTLNGELLFNEQGSELAAKDFDIDNGFLPIVSVGVNQVGKLNLGRQVDSLKYFNVCGLQEGYKPFAYNMERDPPLWMSWKQPTFTPIQDSDQNLKIYAPYTPQFRLMHQPPPFISPKFPDNRLIYRISGC
uniref:B30.2/SPRY domain-containing protein n=1 Tax=Oryzias melastigma TaxID=30732 RepID=A0A3B3BTH6_ORYME